MKIDFCKCIQPYFKGAYFCINCNKRLHRLFKKRKGYKEPQAPILRTKMY